MFCLIKPTTVMKKLVRLFLVFCGILTLPGVVDAQVDQTFWFVVPETTRDHNKQPGVLRITTFDQPAVVSISQPANPAFDPIILNIPANTQVKHEFWDRTGIPYNTMLWAVENGTMDALTGYPRDWPNVTGNDPVASGPEQIPILKKGLLIESTNGANISVYYEVANDRNPERFNLKGRNALGTHFIIPSQNRFNNYSGTPKAREKVDIVATADGTTVTFFFDPARHDFVGKPATGTSFTITLNRGETFSLRSNDRTTNASLGGIFIESSNDIAVTISDDSIIETNSYIHYDLVGDQLIPITKAGTRYIAMHPSHGTRYQGYYGTRYGHDSRTVSNQVFIWPVGDPTGIRINGDAVKNSNGSEVFQRGDSYVTNISDNGIYIESDEPVIVYQVSSYCYELGGGVLPALECTGSRSVTFARVYDADFFIQILTKSKNIYDENGNLRLEAYYQTASGSKVDISDMIFNDGAVGTDRSGFQLVNNTGITINGEQWYTFVRYFRQGEGVSTGLPITIRFKPTAEPAFDELFHLSVLDANGASMSYGYFSSYNSVAINGPRALCRGNKVELRTNGVKVDWYHSSDPTTPFATDVDFVLVDRAGEYWVEVLNSSCESSDRVYIDYIIPDYDLGDDMAVCPGDVVELGLPDFLPFAADYRWYVNGTERTDLRGQFKFSYTAEELTSYEVVLHVSTDVDGVICEHADTIMVTVGPKPIISLGANEAVCKGSELRTEYREGLFYEWTFNGAVDSEETYIIPKQPGVYTLRVYNADGCELTQNINVTINPLPDVTLDDVTECPGESETFSVNIPGATYRWHNNSAASSVTLSAPGNVSVEVTDANGCVATAEATYGWWNEVVFNLDTVVVCYDNELKIEIDDNFINYAWSYKGDPSAPGAAVPLQAPNQVAVDHVLTITAEGDNDNWSGRYFVTADDNVNNCNVEGYFDLIITPLPVIDLVFDKTTDGRMCEGDTIKIEFADPYGREFNAYQWSYSDDGVAFTDIPGAIQSWIVTSTAGFYQLSGAMENNCSTVGQTEVDVVEAPIFEMVDKEACPDQEIVLGITPNSYISNYQGETTPERFEWIRGIRDMEITGQMPILSTAASYTVDGDNRGSYRLTAFNGLGCFASVWADATSLNSINVDLQDITICDNESVTLALPAGLAGLSNYTWYEVIPGREVELLSNEPLSISNRDAGTYTFRVVITSNDGCVTSDDVTVTVMEAPKFTLTDGVVCPGGTITIESRPSYISYLWNGVAGTNSYSVNTAQTLTLEVTDRNGCVTSQTAQISLGTNPSVNIEDVTVCPDAQVILSVPYSAADGYTILWNLPSGRSIRNQSSIEALRGTYSVSVYSEYGCEGSDQAEVIWRDFPTVYFGPNMVDICPVNLPVEIEAQGDYENWTDMIWHDDLYRNQRRRIASLSDTVNVIRVVNADKCWSTASQSVLLALPTYYEAGEDLAECEPQDGVPFNAELNAGEFVIYFDSTSDDPIEVPITGYRWFNMETGDQVGDQQILMATAAGSYMVEVSDGCWLNTDTFNIELFPNPVIAYLDSTLFRQIVVFAENGTAPLQYALNNNAPQSDNVFKNLPNGNYTVYVIDANGCEDSEAFLLETTLNLEVPNFFTPNNDGFNDRWEIIGIEKLPESIIYIYDRYGKLLRKYKASDPAWDGEYLNRPLPSDDYWYVIHLLPIDKYLKGNVTLKR